MIEGLAQRAGGALSRLFGGTSSVTDGPPPPVDMSFAAVETWARANLDMSDWVYLGRSKGSVCLASQVEPAPRFAIAMRIEVFATVKDESRRPYRGLVAQYEIDAASRWIRCTRQALYRRTGLAEAYPSEALDGGWGQLEPSPVPFFQHVLDLCDQAQGAPKGSPDSLLDEDVRAWIARTVDPGDDVYSHWDETGAIYVRPGSVRRVGRNGYSLECRVESFWLHQGFRSWTELLQLHQPSRSKQLIQWSLHADHNLRGEAVLVKDGQWIEAGTRGFERAHFERLYGLAEQIAS